jgi:hypothetical protein
MYLPFKSTYFFTLCPSSVNLYILLVKCDLFPNAGSFNIFNNLRLPFPEAPISTSSPIFN